MVSRDLRSEKKQMKTSVCICIVRAHTEWACAGTTARYHTQTLARPPYARHKRHARTSGMRKKSHCNLYVGLPVLIGSHDKTPMYTHNIRRRARGLLLLSLTQSCSSFTLAHPNTLISFFWPLPNQAVNYRPTYRLVLKLTEWIIW